MEATGGFGQQRNYVPPSAFGFRSILPRTRYERCSMKDKSALERNRLNERAGWQARMHRQNAPEHTSLLTSCTQDAAGYLSNADRFHTDVAGEEYNVRQEQYKKKLAANEFRRNMTSKREEDRWVATEMKAKAEEEYWHKLREDGGKAKKNESNVAYDILTLQYNPDEDGEAQKYHDDMVRYRAKVRSNALIVQGDTRAAYNIISGAEKPPLQYPAPVPKPASMLHPSQQHFQHTSTQPVSARVDRRLTNQVDNFR